MCMYMCMCKERERQRNREKFTLRNLLAHCGGWQIQKSRELEVQERVDVAA